MVGAGCSVRQLALVAERGVSPAVVVVRLPVADHHPRLSQRPEHVDVEAFVAHPAVERLDIAVAPGLAGWGEVQADAFAGPVGHRGAGELETVVAAFGQPAGHGRTILSPT